MFTEDIVYIRLSTD